MVVCPSCRHANAEEADVCERCGSSLAPGFSAFLPARRSESERPQFELPAPAPPSKWRPYVVFGIVAVAVLGAGGAYLLRPNPCRGTNFRSENFEYCLVVPDGWEAGPARFGPDVTLDHFSPRAESATVVVEAVDLLGGTALEDWSLAVRQRGEADGVVAGDATPTELDGVPALRWDVTVAPEVGEESQMREVVSVRGDVGWRVTLVDDPDGFASSAVEFAGMLESWKFR